MKVIDLTHKIQEDMPVYPGTETPKLIPANSYEVDGFKETLMQMYSHTGTHMDPPAHLFADRTTLDQFPASQFIGKALVIDCRSLQEGQAITMEQLNPYGDPGTRQSVIVLPAPADWTTPRGLELFSPRFFGFDMDYVPFFR